MSESVTNLGIELLSQLKTVKIEKENNIKMHLGGPGLFIYNIFFAKIVHSF